MQSVELDALSQAISNDARVLYCLGLRPEADTQTGVTQPLNYKKLMGLLNSKEDKYQLGRQLNSLLKELIKVGLVNFQRDEDLNKSFNRKQLVLPLLALKQEGYHQLHSHHGPMNLDFVPHTGLFADLAKLVGMIEVQYTSDELGEFVAYWLGRPGTQCSMFQWTQKFVFNLKQKRLATGLPRKNVEQVGTQLVNKQAKLEADDNAKQLVAKYSKG